MCVQALIYLCDVHVCLVESVLSQVFVYVYSHVCMWMHVYVDACACVYVCVCTYMCVHACVCVCFCACDVCAVLKNITIHTMHLSKSLS